MSDDIDPNIDPDILVEMRNPESGRTACIIPVEDYLLPNDGRPFQVIGTLDPDRVLVIISRAVIEDLHDDMGPKGTFQWIVENSTLAVDDYFSVQGI